jgi:hypothetical protein
MTVIQLTRRQDNNLKQARPDWRNGLSYHDWPSETARLGRRHIVVGDGFAFQKVAGGAV